MLGHLGSGLAEGGALELRCHHLSAARPPRGGKEGRFLSIPGVLGGQQMGRAGPRCAVPKPGLIPKFSLPCSVAPCPFLLHAQACRPTAAVAQVYSEGTVSLEKTLQG